MLNGEMNEKFSIETETLACHGKGLFMRRMSMDRKKKKASFAHRKRRGGRSGIVEWGPERMI